MHYLIGCAVVVLMAVGATVPAADEEPPTFKLVTHFEVWIGRPAEGLRPYILDTSAWTLETVANPEQARGAGRQNSDLNTPRLDREIRSLKKTAEQRH